MVNVPTRCVVVVFAATEYVTVPLPEPEPPDVTIIQLTLLPAVQGHPAGEVTLAVPFAPL